MGHRAKSGSGTFVSACGAADVPLQEPLMVPYFAGSVSKTSVKRKYWDRSAGSQLEVQANVLADRREMYGSSGLIGGEVANDFAQPVLNRKNPCLRQRQTTPRQPLEEITISD